MDIEKLKYEAQSKALHITDVSGSALFNADCMDILPLIPDKSVQLILDRDVNASRNIIKEGLKNISAGTVEYKGGEEIRPTSLAYSVKPEAPSALGKG